MHGSVGAVFFQIYYQTDRDRFFHNLNRCTLSRVGFPTYNGAVWSVWNIKKKKLFLFNNKKIGLSSPISIYHPVRFHVTYKLGENTILIFTFWGYNQFGPHILKAINLVPAIFKSQLIWSLPLNDYRNLLRWQTECTHGIN